MVNQSKGLPKRSSFLKQILDGGDHSMTGSYIPHCWMTLRRWQEAQTLSRGLITAREYTVIDDALASIINQLRQKKREIYGRPEAYARAHEDSVQALSREVDKVAMTRVRLETLRFQRISLADVYGDYAHRPEVLAEGLGRWTRQAENTLQHQLAMAPPIGSEKDQFGSPHEQVVGAPHSLDLDLIG
ncbi:hypothetical protein FRT60_06865 [Pseudomonas haemolytica]|uniref:Uncharacterized protein n=1 Tax=Pseudomonas haemolytica TaxID=2600065 RepID=A0A646NVQ8_9PSED|nr:hypothetical protein [Pseudomonas haemolytica]MRJ20059.1 hypothetical protein [Pseudomonas haemolytica]